MQFELFTTNSIIECSNWWFRARRQLLLKLIAKVRPVACKMQVADVGCGTGGNVAALAEKYEAIGIDVSPAAIALGRRQWPAVKLLCGEAAAIVTQRECEPDLFLLADVLEHVRDDCCANHLIGQRTLATASTAGCASITLPAQTLVLCTMRLKLSASIV